jgi:hypothetical protein
MSTSSPNDTPPIDRPVLENLHNRLQTSDEFDVVYIETTPRTRLIAEYDLAYYPNTVDHVYIDIRWYTTNDFSIHYHEDRSNDQ